MTSIKADPATDSRGTIDCDCRSRMAGSGPTFCDFEALDGFAGRAEAGFFGVGFAAAVAVVLE
ncbi:MAG: hypothetical protein ABJM29_09295 [Rhizobiaceae bacterium]